GLAVADGADAPDAVAGGAHFVRYERREEAGLVGFDAFPAAVGVDIAAADEAGEQAGAGLIRARQIEGLDRFENFDMGNVIFGEVGADGGLLQPWARILIVGANKGKAPWRGGRFLLIGRHRAPLKLGQPWPEAGFSGS